MADKNSSSIQVKDLRSWKRGQISYFSRDRMQEDALKAAYNVIYDYDAIVRPRGSFYTSKIPDLPEGLTPVGCDFPFKRSDGTEGLLNLFTDGVNTSLYVLRPDMSTWKKFDTVFDNPKLATFAQTANVVVIGNGVNKFTYYDIETDSVKRLSRVDDPTETPKVDTVGFSGTNALDYYYRIAYNGIGGSTKMSPPVKVSSSTIRDTWKGTKSVTVKIDDFKVDPDARSWNLYVASVSTGTGAPTDSEYMKVAEGLPLTQKQYQDTGEITLLQSAPVENTTEGLTAKYFTNISGRLWAIDNKEVVYWGGDVGNELYFGSANGSDSYVVDSGGIETPMALTLGRDNAGTTCINLLTRVQAGQGAIWDVYATTNNITANNQTFSTGTYQFKKREGNDGTDAPFSVIHENNNAYYLSMDGFKSTGVKPNISGIQSTDIISSAIRDRVLNLSYSNLAKCYAAYYDESLYWTVAYGQEKNNEVWVYDILHGGIWSIWRIESDCIFRWSPNEEESPSLYIRQGNKLLRYYKNSHTHSDSSGVFKSYIESGLVPFADNYLEWVHLLKAVWRFGLATGFVDLTINIHSKNGEIIHSKNIVLDTAEQGLGGIYRSGWDAIIPNNTAKSYGAWDNRKWDETLSSVLNPGTIKDKKLHQKIRKNADYISFSITANMPGTYYELSHLGLLFTYIGTGIEFLSQKGVIKI
nr:MAG TPA: hypothetical protein [Caudoviricetes sp.]